MQTLHLFMRQMSEAYNNPQQLHALLVHLPIGASVLGLVLLVVLAVTRGRSGGVRWSCFLVLALGALAGYMAADAGGDAKDTAMMNIATAGMDELNTHAAMGGKVWIFLAVTAALVALTAIKAPPFRTISLIVALLAGVMTVAWVGITGHHGGRLVYVYGAVAPPSQNPPAPPTTMPGGH